MKNARFILRCIEPRDVPGALRLSNAEGWNQTVNDWEFLIQGSHNTCMLAEYDNEIIATTTAINYANQVAWLGMVLVNKEHRGQGISKSLLTEVFNKTECKSVKLDATPEGQHVYKKFHFKDEYLIARMTNPAVRSLPPAEYNEDIAHQPAGLQDVSEIIRYDKFIFGTDRTALVRYLVTTYPGKAWILRRNSSIAGFALGREGTRYHHVGPVFASHLADAKTLILKALEQLVSQPVVVDVPCDKADLITWLISTGFTRQRCFIRMYKKENLFAGITANQHLICGPEFG